MSERALSRVKFALSGTAWYAQFNDGSFSSGGLPPQLSAALQRSRTPPLALELGVAGQWFVRFRDGTMAWAGLPPDLEPLVREWPPLLISFAPTGWFTRFEDGSTQWDGMVDELHDLMETRAVDWVSFFAGGYFVRFEDGSCVAEGLPPGLPQDLITPPLTNLLFVSVSPDRRSHFVRSANGFFWRCESDGLEKLEALLAGWVPNILSPDEICFSTDSIPDLMPDGTTLSSALSLARTQQDLQPLEVYWHQDHWCTPDNSR